MLERPRVRSCALMSAERLLVLALVVLASTSILAAGAQDSEVDVGPLIDIHTGARNQSEASVAADTVNNRFLVVWNHWSTDSTDTDVEGQLVDADGTLHGGDERSSQCSPFRLIMTVKRTLRTVWVRP